MGKTEELEDRVFPISKWLGWFLISHVTDGRLYPHYFRLNRATKFAENEKTTLMELARWFGWSQLSTASVYMARAGRTTKAMADRL